MRNLHFFFNDTATTEIYTLSLHGALPICPLGQAPQRVAEYGRRVTGEGGAEGDALRVDATISGRLSTVRAPIRRGRRTRSEEHTSELQSRQYLVCRLLLEKTKILSRPYGL